MIDWADVKSGFAAAVLKKLLNLAGKRFPCYFILCMLLLEAAPSHARMFAMAYLLEVPPAAKENHTYHRQTRNLMEGVHVGAVANISPPVAVSLPVIPKIPDKRQEKSTVTFPGGEHLTVNSIDGNDMTSSSLMYVTEDFANDCRIMTGRLTQVFVARVVAVLAEARGMSELLVHTGVWDIAKRLKLAIVFTSSFYNGQYFVAVLSRFDDFVEDETGDILCNVCQGTTESKRVLSDEDHAILREYYLGHFPPSSPPLVTPPTPLSTPPTPLSTPPIPLSTPPTDWFRWRMSVAVVVLCLAGVLWLAVLMASRFYHQRKHSKLRRRTNVIPKGSKRH
eukprot:GHVS01104358.1.p1 GENE.GHVS01104358.1~~GHVS01104358.1.p1  ORF type:complete len:336 (-),score=24.77 GHVS01104358.1:160-1167(-)